MHTRRFGTAAAIASVVVLAAATSALAGSPGTRTTVSSTTSGTSAPLGPLLAQIGPQSPLAPGSQFVLGGPTVNLSVASDGTIDYHQQGVMAALGAVHVSTQTLQGTDTADGGCSFDNQPQDAGPQDGGTFETELTYNPRTCVQVNQTGEVTQLALQALDAVGEASGSPEPPTVITANDARRSMSYVQRLQAYMAVHRPRHSRLKQVLPAHVAALPTKTAYLKTSFVDPFGIIITRLTTDLRWTPHDPGIKSTEWTYAYKFKYDGWTQHGPTPLLKYDSQHAHPGTGPGWVAHDRASFRNTDFEKVFVALTGPTGYAACGFDAKPAIFIHDQNVYGFNSGNRGSSNKGDSVTGGCSDLVHHNVEANYGFRH